MKPIFVLLTSLIFQGHATPQDLATCQTRIAEKAGQWSKTQDSWRKFLKDPLADRVEALEYFYDKYFDSTMRPAFQNNIDETIFETSLQPLLREADQKYSGIACDWVIFGFKNNNSGRCENGSSWFKHFYFRFDNHQPTLYACVVRHSPLCHQYDCGPEPVGTGLKMCSKLNLLTGKIDGRDTISALEIANGGKATWKRNLYGKLELEGWGARALEILSNTPVKLATRSVEESHPEC